MYQRFKSKSTLRAVFLAVIVVLLARDAMAANGSANAKDMFFEELKSHDTASGAGFAYCLELRRAGQAPVLCNNRFPFQTGDSVRLHIKTTMNGYAYIALIGSSGKKSVLYPPQGSTEDNKLEAGKEYVVPPNGQITFDDRTGEEKLFVIVSQDKVDPSGFASTRGMTIDSEALTGIPQELGKYSVFSNDGFYELGKKAAGSGLVFVHNPRPDEPTVVSLALAHLSRGETPSDPPQPKPDDPNTGVDIMKVRYDLKSLHNDGSSVVTDDSEVVRAFKRLPGPGTSGVNSGHRDQFVAGLNHLYANWVNQQVDWDNKGKLFYAQQDQNLRANDTGERIRTPAFSGAPLPSPGDPGHPWDSPGLASFPPGMAFLQNSLSGGKCAHLVIGQTRAHENTPKLVKVVASGRELDAVWDEVGGPVIIAVNCAAKMFQPSGPGGHVVVLSERRQGPGGGRTSQNEYRLLNSWGPDTDGKPRNGWVGADSVVSAMNYTDAAHDESVPPHRALSKDALPIGGPNKFARGNDGFSWETASTRSWNLFKWVGSGSKARVSAQKSTALFAGDSAPSSAESEAAELRKHISTAAEGLSSAERGITTDAISALLSNKDSDGTPRKVPISDTDKASILHSANRLFNESGKIYSQGLDQGDRNRALIGLLHDTTNPEHINQGGHNTCNVLTIMKIETFLRPAPQVKRFVDMYTNANGDSTVDMPIINRMNGPQI